MIRICISRAAPSTLQRDQWATRRGATILSAAAFGVAAWLGPTALASSSGSVTATINVATRSLTVSPATVTYGNCEVGEAPTGNELALPNGVCHAPTASLDDTDGVTITNGAVPSHIDVSGSAATPSDGGGTWQLCGTPDAKCAGAGGLPAANQFREQNENATGTFGRLSQSAVCDGAFGSAGGCAAAPHEGQVESLQVVGPKSSSDPSATFTTSITWTATP